MTENFLLRTDSIRVWALGAVGAVALHSACVAWVVASQMTGEPDEALGASAIEVGIDFLAPRFAPSDLPPGPEAEASAASPNVLEQKLVEKETALPKATPTETDDPDQVVAEHESKKPAEEDPTKAAVQAAPSAESIATQATAAPSSEAAQESSRSTAPAIGVGESKYLVRTTWQKQLIAHLDKHKRYPQDRANKAAEILVEFVLDRTGRIVSLRILKGSGDPSFDAAALDMMRRSDPVPQPPALVADDGLQFSLPVIFRANAKR